MPVQVIDDPTRSGGFRGVGYAALIGNLLHSQYQQEQGDKAQAAKNYMALALGANQSPYQAGHALPPALAGDPTLAPLAAVQQSPQEAATEALGAAKMGEQKRLLGVDANSPSTSIDDYVGHQELVTGKPMSRDAVTAHIAQLYSTLPDTNPDGTPNMVKQAYGVKLKLLSDANTDQRTQTQQDIAAQNDKRYRDLADQNESIKRDIATLTEQGRQDRFSQQVLNRLNDQQRSIEAAMQRTLIMAGVKQQAAGIVGNGTVPQGAGQITDAQGQPVVAGPNTDLRGKLSPDTINVLKNPGAKIPAKYYQEVASREIGALSSMAGVNFTQPQSPSADDNKRIVASGLAARNIESISELTNFFQKAGAPITGPAIGRYVRMQKKTGSSLDFLGDIFGSAPDRPLTADEQVALRKLPSVVSLDESGNPTSGGALNATTLRQAWNQAAQQVLMFENYLNAAETSATLPRNSAQSILDKFEAVGPNNVQEYRQLLGNLAGLKDHANNVRFQVLSRLYGGGVPYVDPQGTLWVYTGPQQSQRKAIGRVQ